MAKLFGFVQFDFAGALPLADGRYLAGPGAEEGGEEAAGSQSVLVLKRIGAPLESGRRRRRGRNAPDEEAQPLPLTRVTAIRASSPFEGPAEAARWLDEVCEAEDRIEALAGEAIAPLNLALHAQAVAAANPHGHQFSPEQAERVLIGYGSGEEAADSRYTDARQVDLAPRTSRRRRREEKLRPQERVAGVLRGRERLDACETLLLRARADLDAGRAREAAMQLRVGVEALLEELKGAVDDPGHEKDMAALAERREEATTVAGAAISGELSERQRDQAADLLEIAERVLRRRRVLAG